jgi:hypothetical protein
MLKIVVGALVAAALLTAAGCGGKSAAEKQSEAAAAAAGSGRGTITCDGSATSKPSGLPSGFPQPDAVTYVSATKTGPTVVVDGYSTESLEGMYVEYQGPDQRGGLQGSVLGAREGPWRLRGRVQDAGQEQHRGHRRAPRREFVCERQCLGAHHQSSVRLEAGECAHHS